MCEWEKICESQPFLVQEDISVLLGWLDHFSPSIHSPADKQSVMCIAGCNGVYCSMQVQAVSAIITSRRDKDREDFLTVYTLLQCNVHQSTAYML